MISTAQAAVVKKAPVKYILDTTGISMYLSNKKKLVRFAIESCRHVSITHSQNSKLTNSLYLALHRHFQYHHRLQSPFLLLKVT